MNVSVIIATKNRAEVLRRSLEILVGQLAPADELIIADNGSRDHTKSVTIRFSKKARVRYLYEPTPGASYARNAGFRIAKADGVAFLDDDSMVFPDWLLRVKQILRSRKRHYPDALYQGKMVQQYRHNGIFERIRTEQFTRETESFGMNDRPPPFHRLATLIAANIFTYQHTLLRIPGPFNAGTFPFIGEDPDMAYRLIRSGIPIFYAPRAGITHLKDSVPIATLVRQAYLYGRAEALYKKLYFSEDKFILLYGAELSKMQTDPAHRAGPNPQAYGNPEYMLYEHIFHAARRAASRLGYLVHRLAPVRSRT